MKIPIVLVTGFLGSGKTTFLRQIAEANPDWRLIFLVNEFSETSIDEKVLASTGTPTQSVAGGSLFCECKAGEFLRVMRETVLPAHRANPLDAVIVETSGTANPDAIGRLILDHGLSEQFVLHRIVSIVAPLSFQKLVRNLPVLDSQIRCSDLIVINKTDTVDEATLQAVEEEIRLHNKDATLVQAQHCKTPFALTRSLRRLPQGELSTCDANPFATVSVDWPEERSIDDAHRWLEGLPASVLRVKGRIRTSDGFWQIERTVDSTDIVSISQDGVSTASTLVLIAHEDHESILEEAAINLQKSSTHA